MSYEGYEPDVAEVTGAPAERGWLVRMISPQGDGGTPTSFAFLLGGAGAVCFALSMVLDFVTIPVSGEGSDPFRVAHALAITNGSTMGFAFVLGGLGLLTFMGSVINRPEVALRSRLGATGLSMGLIGLVVGTAMRLPEDFSFNGYGGPTVYEPGVLCALAAAILPTVAVWFAARPAARRAADEETEADRRRFERYVPAAPFTGPDPGQPVPRPLMRPAGAMDLTVTPE